MAPARAEQALEEASDRTQVFVRSASNSGAASGQRAQPNGTQLACTDPRAAIPAPAARFIFSAVRRLALQQSLDEAEHILTRSLLDLTASDRAYCLFFRPDNGSVWNIRRPSQSSEMNPGSSLASWAGQRRSTICLDRASQHPHYNHAIDDPFGQGNERLLVQPMLAMGQVVAVLVIARDSIKAPFQDLDKVLCASLAQEAGGLIVHFLSQMFEAQRQSLGQASDSPSLFRQQAMSHRDSGSELGEVLQLKHAWMSWAYRMLVLGAVLGFLLTALVPVHQYASGSTIVRMEGAPMRVAYPGTVERSHVVSGDLVKKGQLLVEFTSFEQEASFADINSEYEQRLVTLLEEPTDKAAKLALQNSAARREQALERLEKLRLRAPRDGVVADLRVQAGQLVKAGEPIVTIVEQDAVPTLVALIPGNYRPQLETGMTLRFKVAGYARADQEATIEWISREVVGPTEARRYLGVEMSDAVAVQGPVVLVRARLPRQTFTADGQEYRFHNGMYGNAEVKIGSETILSSVIDRN